MYKAVLGAICCLSFALSLHAQSPQEKGLQSISRTSAKAIVGFLADDELQGREAGMHGSRLAARYLASCLKEAGIAPLEKDNYYQPFEAYNKERQQRGRWQVHPDSIAILKQGVHRILQMSNVLGTIPGERPDEYVIVGAHFDHLGVDETLANDRIYNGADDNASGISAVLQIARAFLATGQQPLRTVIFAFWDGEEKGLLGSKYFVQSCPFISQVKGYLNFDMIGRNNKPEQPQHVVYFYTAAHPVFGDWLKQDIQDWTQRQEVAHHLRAYGGMGSFNDLPSMRGNHDYIFGFLKSVCYAFGHLYGKREGISPEALMEECLHDVEQAAYHPHKKLNQAIAQHLIQSDLQENLDRL